MRVAGVDCGTNSVRLMVADVDQRSAVQVHREMRVVRLGQGVDRTGGLAPEAIERTRVALVDYARTCTDLGVEAMRMVATSATRDARNRDDFVAMVRATLGVDPEVINGTQEAHLSFDGATHDLDPSGGPFLVVDIGGGSTEFVLGAAGAQALALDSLSVDVGCVRLTERHLVDDPPSSAQIAAAEADVDAALVAVRAAVPVGQARTVLGLAGSVTTVAALALGLDAYDPQRIHLARIPADQLLGACGSLLAMTRDQRAALPFMHPGRVDVIGAGALVLAVVVDRLGLDALTVSESDILDGITRSVAAQHATRRQA